MTRSTLPTRCRPGTAAVNGISPLQLLTLREMLEEQRAFRIDQLMELDAQPTQTGVHHEITTRLRAGAKAALHEVQQALWRIEEGRYGRCTDCGGPVGVERLEILPHVALCMGCQRAYAS